MVGQALSTHSSKLIHRAPPQTHHRIPINPRHLVERDNHAVKYQSLGFVILSHARSRQGFQRVRPPQKAAQQRAHSKTLARSARYHSNANANRVGTLLIKCARSFRRYAAVDFDVPFRELASLAHGYSRSQRYALSHLSPLTSHLSPLTFHLSPLTSHPPQRPSSRRQTQSPIPRPLPSALRPPTLRPDDSWIGFRL